MRAFSLSGYSDRRGFEELGFVVLARSEDKAAGLFAANIIRGPHPEYPGSDCGGFRISRPSPKFFRRLQQKVGISLDSIKSFWLFERILIKEDE